MFMAVKTDNFQMKWCDILLNFAENIGCEYTLKPPYRVPTIYGHKQNLRKLLHATYRSGVQGDTHYMGVLI